jgi:hypothetical protein
MLRQGLGFMIYSNSIQFFNQLLSNHLNINRFIIYSISSVISKIIAMVLEAPLSMLKTRIEVINSLHIHN